MATYAIGDVQGCYDSLQGLLQLVNFNPAMDTLWFCGDLVNRGPKSAEVLRFVRSLGKQAVTVLGNHDLHLLAVHYGVITPKKKDTFEDVLLAPDREALCQWLVEQPLFHWDRSLKHAVVHAGIPPMWSLEHTETYAEEVTSVLRSSDRLEFFRHMYSDKPSCWGEQLQGLARLRLITNYLTRMRFCDAQGCLELGFKKGAEEVPPGGYSAWFLFPNPSRVEARVLFGHWAALNGIVAVANLVALDTGCAWGGKLTAYCIETGVKTAIQSIEFPERWGLL
jgi:bis(5'-nucleosyl)-tetraphosphatase (symmetrical)